MNKLEAKVRLKQLLDQGYLTHSLLLEIYEDTDEIPEYMWEFLVTDPRKEPPRQFTICTGAEGAKALKEVINNSNINLK